MGNVATSESDSAVQLMLSQLALERGSEVAIDHTEAILTFGELHERAQQRVSELETDVYSEPQTAVVPVLVDFGLNSVIDIIAHLSLRQPFAPISSTTPAGRLRDYRSRLEQWNGLFSSARPGRVNPSNTGVVLFTSGSTGRPKGVVIPWGTIDFRLQDYFATLGRNALPLRFSSLAPLSVASGLLQIFLLLNGATMVRRDPSSLSPRALLDELSRSRISHLFLPSQIFRMLVQLADLGEVHFPDCELLSIGGESVRCEDVQRFRRTVPEKVILRHVLGATESMTYLSYSTPLDSLPHSGQVPVNGPTIPPTSRLIPISDAVYEVWCTGPIASGYLDDESLDRSLFTFDPKGVRWWKSGDLVSWGQDGNLLHRGRRDDTIHIPGKLASPTELIHQLLEIPAITGVVVMVDSINGEARFDAHVEVPQPEGFFEDSVREHLAQVLESHMLPRRIVQWASFPVDSQGKADRSVMRASTSNE